jgi:DNA-binding response OmpR family regulator
MRRIVLVQEDAGWWSQAAAEVLRAACYEVTTCPEPGAAFAAVCALQPDLVILDVPGDHRLGWQVLNQLKQQEETAAVPVLVAAPAGPALEAERHTLEERGVHLVPQPLRDGQLPAHVAEAFGPARPTEPRSRDS